MRVTHVIPGLTHERGGTSTVLEALTRHQAAAGLDVTVLRTDQGVRHGERPVVLGPGVSERVSKVFGPDRIAYAPGFARLVREQLRRSDVFHVHSVFTYPVHAALKLAASACMPVVLSPHGVLHRKRLGRSVAQKRAYLTLWGGLVRRACTAWHYTSDDEAADSWPYDSSPRFVLGLGIDPEPFDIDRSAARRELARRWPQLGDSPYVLYLGRIHPLKRPDLLLAAFLAGAPPHYKLAVAGPDEVGLWAKLAAQHLGGRDAAGRVVYLGTVLGEEKRDLLAGARLFALPSEHENFGLTVLEAIGAGTPVLASEHVDVARTAAAAGFAETLPLDLIAWRERLASLLSEETVPALWTGAARRWVRDEFSWRKVVERMSDRYACALGTDGHFTERG